MCIRAAKNRGCRVGQNNSTFTGRVCVDFAFVVKSSRFDKSQALSTPRQGISEPYRALCNQSWSLTSLYTDLTRFHCTAAPFFQ